MKRGGLKLRLANAPGKTVSHRLKLETNHKLVSMTGRIIEWLFFVILLVLPLIMLPNFVLNFEIPKMLFFRVITLLIVLLFVIKTLAKGEFEVASIFKSRLIRKLLFFFFAVLLVSTVFSVAPSLSFWGGYYRMQGVYSILHYFLFFILLIASFHKTQQWEKAIKFLLAGFIITIIFGLLQNFDLVPFNNPIWQTSFGRIFSTFSHPSDFANYIIIVFFPLLAFAMNRKAIAKQNLNLWLLMIISLTILGLILAKSRATIMGFIIGISFFTIVYGYFSKNKKVFVAGILLPIIAALSVIFINIFSGSNFIQQNYLLNRVVLKGEELRSAEVRPAIWKSTIKMIADRPFFGYGSETFPLVLAKNVNTEISKLEPNNGIPDKAHNNLLEISFNFGMAGLILFLGIIFTIFKMSFSELKQSNQINIKVKRLEILGILSSFVATFISTLFGFLTTVHFVLITFLLAYLFFLLSDESIKKTFNFSKWQKVFTISFIGIFVAATIILQNVFYLMADHYALKGIKALQQNNANEVVKNLLLANTFYPNQSYYNYFLASVYEQLEEFELAEKYSRNGDEFEGKN